MCGRYTLTAPGELVAELFEAELAAELAPRWNIAPAQPAPVVRRQGHGRRIQLVEWGLVPSWAPAEDGAPAQRSINARAESLRDKPSFRDSFAERRCLVPADGFYEWQAEGPRRKIPHHLRPAGDGVIAFAGLWDARRENADWRETFAIVTTDSSPDLLDLHDRMPVVLPRETWRQWLDPASDLDALERLLRPAPAGFFVPTAVGPRVNSVDNDDPSLLDPDPGPRQLRLL